MISLELWQLRQVLVGFWFHALRSWGEKLVRRCHLGSSYVLYHCKEDTKLEIDMTAAQGGHSHWSHWSHWHQLGEVGVL